MEEKYKPEHYVWWRGLNYWKKVVLNGQVALQIDGSEEEGYWGTIINTADDYDRFDPIFTTKPKKGLHVPFRTPENCAVHLEHEWKEIVKEEGNKL